jgi:hypothetical protein
LAKNPKLVLLAALLSAFPAFAQPAASREVHADRTITFRLPAPNAKEVQLRCEGVKNSAMQKATTVCGHSPPSRWNRTFMFIPSVWTACM